MPARLFSLSLLGAALLLGASSGVSASASSIPISIEHSTFIPATVTAHLDQETTFRISSSESVHGIASDELGIPKTVILPNKITEVSFTPRKIGTYVLHCLIVCGPGHEDMMLTVQVVP